MVGSGNRQTEFALRYRQYIPADRTEPDPLDPLGDIQHVFGANYVDHGTEMTLGLSAATDPAHMFLYQHLPVTLLSDPNAAINQFDPWAEE